ncbi:MAG: hypothetical protein ACOCWA_00185 [Bacteroidota bacterium]
MRKLLAFGILFFVFHSAYSQQIREFSTDTSDFIIQFEDFMKGIDEEDEYLLDRFQSLWKYDSLSYEQKAGMIVTSNHMLRRRARPSPTFVNYLDLIIEQFDPDLQARNFDAWFESYNHLVASSEVTFNEIERAMNFVLAIIRDSSLYNLAGTHWTASHDNFRFKKVNHFPVVEYKDVDLTCYSNRDTLKIFNTTGEYNLIHLKWKGEGGRVNWERAGLRPDEVYADLSNYDIEINRSQYTADSVKFFYRKYFDFPLEGYLQERAMPIANPDNATYPKFFSYQSIYNIPDLFRGIEFHGGLSMQGAKLVGTGTNEDPASLMISESDTLRMRIKSRNIVIREASVSSTSCEMIILLENDSIYHPDLDFLYLEDSDEIRITKKEVYTSGVPYSNSYHNVNMNFEELSWKRGTKNIDFQPSIGRAIGTAQFESNRFFNYNFFSELQGRDFAHPLISLYNFSRQVNGVREFPLRAYSGNIGRPDYQVRHQMMKLSRLGFIFYDDEKDRITLKDKLFYFIEASMGKTDFDVILFESNVKAPNQNATLNLENNDLTIYGIPNIFLSDSQNVVIVPAANKIVMKRNKNFQFNGSIKAGLITMYGSNFFFSYDSFKVNLQDIDSLRVQVMTTDRNTGAREITNIANLIQDLTGEILIDKPDNKSGLEDNPDYPVFRSNEFSYVYFDDPSIQGGVYDRGEVYFELDPFELDSLDNFKRQGMELVGTFESGGMLPPLEQKLTLRDDNSLGFAYDTPEIGLPVYDGKGTFYNALEMSSNGLRGSGHLDYLTSTTYSDDFTFHPDSMMTMSREFMIRKQISGTEFPEVSSKENKVKWFTQEDEFYADMMNTPFTMFSDTVVLHGDLLLEPDGLSGNGDMDLVTSAIVSDQFRYGAERIKSDTSDFRLNSLLSDKLAINTSNVKADIDFESKKGQFYANEDYTLVEFPEIIYSSNLDFFEWNIQEENVKMGLNKEIETAPSEDGLFGPRYYSLLPSQDSLNFVSPLAIYDYKKSELVATEVPYIQVADARIFPGDRKLTVGKNANMRQLQKASILTDYRNEYYNLYDASVSIKGKYDYTASADYDYVDLTGEPQKIHFSDIHVDTSGQTIASGNIDKADNFTLSPYFEYKGEVFLASREPFLRFKGGTRVIHDCKMGQQWLKFEANIDPNKVMIPVNETPVQYDMTPTYAGTMITRDSTHVYSTFFSMRKDYFDKFIFSSQGFLRFDTENEKYEIASAEKLKDRSETGNYLALDRNNCIMESQGELNLQTDYGQIEMLSFGEGVHNIAADTFAAKLMMSFDFLFSDEALTVFANDLDSIAVKPVDLTDGFYQQSLSEMIGTDAAERLKADLGLYGEYRNIPEAMNKTLILNNVNLRWSQYARSYRYQGELGVVRLGDRMINRKVNVIMSLTKRASGDLFDIYMVLDDNTWYYFGYNPGSLQVVSSNRTFNNIIFELKSRERKLRTRPGEPGYVYSLAPERRLQLFLRRFNAEMQQEMEMQ